MAQDDVQFAQREWVSFPGGELEGKPPRVLCAACRAGLNRAAGAECSTDLSLRTKPADGDCHNPPDIGHSAQNRLQRARTLCFQCYRADLDRSRSLRAAGNLNTASEARFQSQLPFERLDKPRLQMLKAERSQARVLSHGQGRFVGKRHDAQIAARHALQAITAGFKACQPAASQSTDRARAIAAAIHAAELQLPESWLPFVVAR